MPKAPMSAKKIESIREKILDTALEIILNQGFNSLSVRKIASKLGISATTIYNYYKNKDDLNLMIRVKGFETLYHYMTKGIKKNDPFENKLGAMIKGTVEFGYKYKGYYELMFTLNTPKYLDYKDTELEKEAVFEKDTAMRCYTLVAEPFIEYIPGELKGIDAFVLFQVMRLWSDVHGMISLLNSRLFLEVTENVDAYIKKRTDQILAYTLELKNKIDSKDLSII